MLRVEFEFGRQGLSEYGIILAVRSNRGRVGTWMAATDWLTYRLAWGRWYEVCWAVAPEWQAIRDPRSRRPLRP